MVIVTIILSLMVSGVNDDHVWAEDARGNTYWCANNDGIDDQDLETTRAIDRDECFRCADDIALCQKYAPYWINEIEHKPFIMGWTGNDNRLCDISDAPTDGCGNVEVTLYRLVNSDYYRPHLDALVALWTAESKMDETTSDDKTKLAMMVEYLTANK
jgi:hypothetical protein